MTDLWMVCVTIKPFDNNLLTSLNVRAAIGLAPVFDSEEKAKAWVTLYGNERTQIIHVTEGEQVGG